MRYRMISTLMTSAKLEILINRENHIKSVLADVNNELKKIRKDKEHYKVVLQKLILQAMYQVILILLSIVNKRTLVFLYLSRF